MINKWGVELSDYYIMFKFIKGIKNTLASTSFKIFDHDFMEPNPPEKIAINMDLASSTLTRHQCNQCGYNVL